MSVINKQRLALSIYFFLSGICFATWASRIPTIKEFFNFNDAVLGSVLMVMPVGSILGVPFSGWLVSKFDSRTPLIYSFVGFSISLVAIGYAPTPFLLVLSLGFFSFCLRLINISMNTQSISLQNKYKKKIVGSFHGIWSLGGLIGVGFSTVMVKMGVPLNIHVLIIGVITVVASLYFFQFTLKNDKASTGNKFILKKPDPFIMYLGAIVFLAAICEGGIYDWAGVYFKEVIEEDIFTFGYLIFMACMTISRFTSDRLMEHFGMPKLYIFSALLIISGILLAVLFPYFWPAVIGFCLVGFGVAAIFPMTFILAGTSKKYSPGMAISIISTYAIVGMFIGPPLIGYLSFAFGLKAAFITFVIGGFLLIPFSQLFFKRQKKTD